MVDGPVSSSLERLTNRRIVLAERPRGLPELSDFRLETSPLPEPAEGEVLVRSAYLSLDPYMRGRMTPGASYAEAVEIDEVMVGDAVGEIVVSRHPAYEAGQTVVGALGWQEYGAVPGERIRPVDPDLAPVSTSLGVLGMPGMTAYFGLIEVGRVREGETVVVSGAAGAVGSLAGQIAGILGCRVIGVAGSDAKVAWVTEELGFDGAFNYRERANYRRALRDLCPDGVDVYFDNVGGEITDAVFPLLNRRSRVVLCGQISQYNLTRPERGPRLLWHLVVKEARAEGFLVFSFRDRWDEGVRQMAAWLSEGRLRYREDIVEGLENAPDAFIGMLQGDNIGKRLIRL